MVKLNMHLIQVLGLIMMFTGPLMMMISIVGTKNNAVVIDVKDYPIGSSATVTVIRSSEMCYIDCEKGAYPVGYKLSLFNCSIVTPVHLAYLMLPGILISFLGAMILERNIGMENVVKKG